MSDYDRKPEDPAPINEPASTPPPADPATPPAAAPGTETAGITGSESLPDESIPKEHRTWGLIAHLAALAGFTGIPAANILGPLIVWLIKKDEMPFVDEQGKESLNFQITVTIALLVCIPLMFVCVGIVLAVIVGLAALILSIIAGIKANEGRHYRYPFTWRIIK